MLGLLTLVWFRSFSTCHFLQIRHDATHTNWFDFLTGPCCTAAAPKLEPAYWRLSDLFLLSSSLLTWIRSTPCSNHSWTPQQLLNSIHQTKSWNLSNWKQKTIHPVQSKTKKCLPSPSILPSLPSILKKNWVNGVLWMLPSPIFVWMVRSHPCDSASWGVRKRPILAPKWVTQPALKTPTVIFSVAKYNGCDQKESTH